MVVVLVSTGIPLLILIWKYLLNKSTFVKIEITTMLVILKLMYQNPITIYKFSKQPKPKPKPKMSNSLELVTGPIETVQKKY
jgi:hypothetical protein